MRMGTFLPWSVMAGCGGFLGAVMSKTPSEDKFDETCSGLQPSGNVYLRTNWRETNLKNLILSIRFLVFASLVVFLLLTRPCERPWSSLVEGDEGCIGTSSKLLCLWQNQKICSMCTLQHSTLVWFLAWSICSSPSIKELHGTPVHVKHISKAVAFRSIHKVWYTFDLLKTRQCISLFNSVDEISRKLSFLIYWSSWLRPIHTNADSAVAGWLAAER